MPASAVHHATGGPRTRPSLPHTSPSLTGHRASAATRATAASWMGTVLGGSLTRSRQPRYSGGQYHTQEEGTQQPLLRHGWCWRGRGRRGRSPHERRQAGGRGGTRGDPQAKSAGGHPRAGKPASHALDQQPDRQRRRLGEKDGGTALKRATGLRGRRPHGPPPQAPARNGNTYVHPSKAALQRGGRPAGRPPRHRSDPARGPTTQGRHWAGHEPAVLGVDFFSTSPKIVG